MVEGARHGLIRSPRRALPTHLRRRRRTAAAASRRRRRQVAAAAGRLRRLRLGRAAADRLHDETALPLAQRRVAGLRLRRIQTREDRA